MPQDKDLLQKRVLRKCSVAPLHVTGVSSGSSWHGVPSPPPSSEPRAVGQMMSGPDGVHLGEPGSVGRCGWSWVLRCKWRPNSGWGRRGTSWRGLRGWSLWGKNQVCASSPLSSTSRTMMPRPLVKAPAPSRVCRLAAAGRGKVPERLRSEHSSQAYWVRV